MDYGGEIMIRKTVLSFIALSVVVVLSGCLTFDIGSPDKRKTSGTALKAMKDTLITVTTSAHQLCDQGVLSEDDCVVVEQSYAEGRQLLISAKKAWDEMIVMDSFDTRKSYDDLIVSAVRLIGNIETIIRKEN